MLTLKEIKEQVVSNARKIDVPPELLPTYETPRQDGHPCIQLGHLVYQIVYFEKGQELERKTSFNIEELLYDIFEDVTFSMASKYELENRKSNQDPRKVLFKKQIELMSQISEQFADWLKKRIDEILRRAPYNDVPFKT